MSDIDTILLWNSTNDTLHCLVPGPVSPLPTRSQYLVMQTTTLVILG